MTLGHPRIHLETCGSTNDELAARAAGAATGTAVIARTQSAGRGRGDHRWHSPPGNLYASILLRPPIEPARAPAISLVIGIAVARALRRYRIDARLKWPNDVVVGAAKIAGILAESTSRGGGLDHVIAGIGVNVAGPLPAELPATSIAIERGGDAPDPDRLLDAICAELGEPLARFSAAGVPAIHDDWERLWRDRGRRGRAEINGQMIEGEMIGITDDGHLRIDSDGRRLAVVAGGVEII